MRRSTKKERLEKERLEREKLERLERERLEKEKMKAEAQVIINRICKNILLINQVYRLQLKEL